jgi:hypothetical protein
MEITEILLKKYPNAEWTLDGDDYEGLKWLSKTKKPTKEDLEKFWFEIQKELEIEQKEKENNKKSAFLKLSELGLTQKEISAITNP